MSISESYQNIAGMQMSSTYHWMIFLGCVLIFLCTVIVIATAWWQMNDGKWMSFPMFLIVAFIALAFGVLFCVLLTT